MADHPSLRVHELVGSSAPPVDVNSAGREELYELPGLTWALVDAIIADREQHGRFKGVADLARVDGIGRDTVAGLIAFAEAPEPWKLQDVLRGKLDVRTAWRADQPNADEEGSAADRAPPTASLMLRTEAADYWHIGLGLTVSRQLEDPEQRDHVLGEPFVYETRYAQRFDPAKAYVHTPRSGETWSAIAGSFRTGFGMGTIIDNTGRELPDGWRPDNEFSHDTDVVGGGPVRHRDRTGFFGGAVGLHHLAAGGLHLSAQAFASVVRRDSYQEIGRDVPDDEAAPLSKTKLEAAAKVRLVEPPDDISRTQNTIIDAFRETTAGGHLRLHLAPGTEVGFTGYWGQVDFELEGDDLVFVRSSKYPREPTGYGAFGGHAFVELHDDFVLRGEYGRTLEGGNALWTRGVYDTGPFEVELGFRMYDEDYENPHSSPYAQADELNGHRARDERGVRWRVSWRDGPRLQLRLTGDVWQRNFAQCTDETVDETGCVGAAFDKETFIAEEATNMRHTANATWRPVKPLRLQIKPSYSDNDVGSGGADDEFSGGSGDKFDLFGKVDVDATSWLRVSAAYRHRWASDPGPKSIFDPDVYDPSLDPDDGMGEANSGRVPVDINDPDATLLEGEYRQDFYVWLEAAASYKRSRFSVRYKHNEEGVGHPSFVDSNGTFEQISVKAKQLKTDDLYSLSLRYDFVRFTDDRKRWYEPKSTSELDVPNATRNHHLLVANATLHF